MVLLCPCPCHIDHRHQGYFAVPHGKEREAAALGMYPLSQHSSIHTVV